MSEMSEGLLADLGQEIAARPIAYLLTVSTDGHPHTAQVSVSGFRQSSDDGATELHLDVSRLGRTSHRNVTAGSQISLLWPPLTTEGYSLIANGVRQQAGDGALTLSLTRAVLHRPGEVPEGTSLCGSDCIPLWN